MAQLNPIDLRFNIPSVEHQSAQLKGLMQKQSAEHTALLKRQENEQKQYGVNVGALRAKALKEVSNLEATHGKQKIVLLEKLAQKEKEHADQIAKHISAVRIRSALLAEKEQEKQIASLEKMTKAHERELGIRIKQEQSYADKVRNFQLSVMKRSLGQGDPTNARENAHNQILASTKHRIDLETQYQKKSLKEIETEIDRHREKRKTISNSISRDNDQATNKELQNLSKVEKQTIEALTHIRNEREHTSGKSLLGIGKELVSQQGGQLGQLATGAMGTAAIATGIGLVGAAFIGTVKAGLSLEDELDKVNIGYRTLGLSVAQAKLATEGFEPTIDRLANKYSLMSSDLRVLESRYLTFGGSQNNLSEKMEVIIGIVSRTGLSYDEAAESLAKLSNPEFTERLGRKLNISFTDAKTGAEKYKKILDTIKPTLEGVAETSHDAGGEVRRLENSITEAAKHGGESLLLVLAPALTKVASIVSDLAKGMKYIAGFGLNKGEQENVDAYSGALERFYTKAKASGESIDAMRTKMNKYVDNLAAAKTKVQVPLTEGFFGVTGLLGLTQKSTTVIEKMSELQADILRAKVGELTAPESPGYDKPKGTKGEDLQKKAFEKEMRRLEDEMKGRQVLTETYGILQNQTKEEIQIESLRIEIEYDNKIAQAAKSHAQLRNEYILKGIKAEEQIREIENTTKLRDEEIHFRFQMETSSDFDKKRLQLSRTFYKDSLKLSFDAMTEAWSMYTTEMNQIDVEEAEAKVKRTVELQDRTLQAQIKGIDLRMKVTKDDVTAEIALETERYKRISALTEHRHKEEIRKSKDDKDLLATVELENTTNVENDYQDHLNRLADINKNGAADIKGAFESAFKSAYTSFGNDLFKPIEDKLKGNPVGKLVYDFGRKVVDNLANAGVEKLTNSIFKKDEQAITTAKVIIDAQSVTVQGNLAANNDTKPTSDPTANNLADVDLNSNRSNGGLGINPKLDAITLQKIGGNTGTHDLQGNSMMSSQQLKSIMGGAQPQQILSDPDDTTVGTVDQKIATYKKRERDRDRHKELLQRQEFDNNYVQQIVSKNGGLGQVAHGEMQKYSLDASAIGRLLTTSNKQGQTADLPKGYINSLTGTNDELIAQAGKSRDEEARESVIAMIAKHTGIMTLGGIGPLADIGDGLAHAGSSATKNALTNSWGAPLANAAGNLTHSAIHATAHGAGDVLVEKSLSGVLLPQEREESAHDDRAKKEDTSPKTDDAKAKPIEAGFTNAMAKLSQKGAGGGKIGVKDVASVALSTAASFIPGVGPILSGLLGPILGLQHGGVVPQYLADGGIARAIFKSHGTDTVPAMLTPGERVLTVAGNRKYEADQRNGFSGGDAGLMHGAMLNMSSLLHSANGFLSHIAANAGFDPYGSRTAQMQSQNERTFGRF